MATTPAQHATLEGIRAAVAAARAAGRRVGLVPTMGYLHDGHLSLVRLAAERTDFVVVSIYVNPTQFGPNEDLAAYPRDLARDLELLGGHGVDIVFTPSDAIMYPDGFATGVEVTGLSAHLCGASRPVHFGGVATIVTKLFAVLAPDVAVFGQKDYQQLAIIRRLVRDLGFAVEIVGGPTVREPDGLAMSSRNAYLTADERAAAPALYRALSTMRDRYRSGERDGAALRELGRAIIEAQGPLRVDYLEVIDPDDLRLLPERAGERLPERAHAAAAVFAGRARLIDNLRLSE